ARRRGARARAGRDCPCRSPPCARRRGRRGDHRAVGARGRRRRRGHGAGRDARAVRRRSRRHARLARPLERLPPWRPADRHLRLAHCRPGARRRQDDRRPARAAPRTGCRGRHRGGAGRAAGTDGRPLPGEDRHLPGAARPATHLAAEAGDGRARDRPGARSRWFVDDRGGGRPVRPSPAGVRPPVIVTVTPNPSIDRTLRIPPLVRGRVMRAMSATAEAGGKGINVARALAAHGQATVAVAPLSAASAGEFSALLGAAAALDAVPIAGPARVNVSLVEDDGTVTKVNEPGPELGVAEVEAVLDRVAALAVGATWVAGCGSLPPGAPPDFYARLVGRVPARARVA